MIEHLKFEKKVYKLFKFLWFLESSSPGNFGSCLTMFPSSASLLKPLMRNRVRKKSLSSSSIQQQFFFCGFYDLNGSESSPPPLSPSSSPLLDLTFCLVFIIQVWSVQIKEIPLETNSSFCFVCFWNDDDEILSIIESLSNFNVFHEVWEKNKWFF